jgi:outer membrane protein OmpA-like peptidoglycan-associated protein
MIVVVMILVFAFSCASPGKRTAIGAGAGAVAGAGLGAIVSKDKGKGALIGGAIGALLGGAVGNYLDKQAQELAAIAETRRTEEGIVTNLKSDMTFDTGKATLKPAGQSKVGQVATIVKKYPDNRYTIIGHTDDVGNDTLNQKLSETRASTVKAMLVSQGVPAETIQTVGAGKTQPIADNKTKDGRAQNRRVEIQIIPAQQ